jgi:hypothetical protein
VRTLEPSIASPASPNPKGKITLKIQMSGVTSPWISGLKKRRYPANRPMPREAAPGSR